MLAAIQGTLVPLQFRFMEDDLEKLRSPKSLEDARVLPDRIVDPIIMMREIDEPTVMGAQQPTDDDLEDED